MTPPPDDVREAFGAVGQPAPLPGGRGLAWQVGDLVFKPSDLAPAELAWQADVLPTVDAHDFRLAIPQRAEGGELVVDGWTAWSYLTGEHRDARWLDVIAVGDRFHRAVAGLARPAFLDARTDPWSIGDRVAWGEAPVEPYRDVPHVLRLADRRRPVGARSQLIHGDLTGNVLFADGLPPAVIDLSPYWRPTAFATAIVVADALVWEGADETLLESVAGIEDLGQMLMRALLYRLVAAVEGGFEDDYAAIERRYGRTVELALALVTPSTSPSGTVETYHAADARSRSSRR
jgi:uncharacterized protein (TIGR02569 family)